MVVKTIKNIPNLISVFRILGSLALLTVKPFTTGFFVIYIACGISDMLDGWIARKFNLVTQTGQTLDSISDFILITVLLFVFSRFLSPPIWAMIWVLAIALLRLLSFIVAWVKYSQVALLHTYANKATGFLLFCFPILYTTIGLDATAVLLCLVATLSAVEELLIQLRSKTLDRDVKSLLFKQRQYQ